MEFILKSIMWFGVLSVLFFVAEPICLAGAVNGTQRAMKNTAKEFIAKQLAIGTKANRLLTEKSPYLLQHAFNPVNWYPWGEEAFAKARRENKPIFLSIGYSTCHWCHVMAHESFENNDIAEIINRYFVAIKVDREERPDLDQVYMAVTQAMTGSGGWPMTLFLTPDLKPFFAGTYFPPKAKYGRPGLTELLESIHNAWEKDPQDIMAKSSETMRRISELTERGGQEGPVNESILLTASREFALNFDSRYGGFGTAPKFPRPSSLFFLLRQYKRTNDATSRDMVLKTLQAMAAGGMYDQVGGGFHRYSVDEAWRVPHFEKMLYDQAQLAVGYLEAYQVSGVGEYKRVAGEILNYVIRDLTDRQGGFYSAEDADSPLPIDRSRHGEGAFYTWSAGELQKILGKKKAVLFAARYGVEVEGNVHSDPQDEFAGLNILYQKNSLAAIAEKFNISVDEVGNVLATSRNILLEVRDARPRPHLDDKVLASWNGLMIGAMARGYQVIHAPEYLRAATDAASFVWEELFDQDRQVLLHRYRDGTAGIEATLDDYAFLIQGYLDLYEASFEFKWLERADVLSKAQVKYFADQQKGGFYDTSGRDKTVLLRMKSDYDGAEPTGNSVSGLNFLRLGEMMANKAYTEEGSKTIKAFGTQLQQAPHALPQMLVAMAFHYGQPLHVAITGNMGDPDVESMLKIVHSSFLPQKTLTLITGGGEIEKRRADLAAMSKINDKATVYLCQGYACKPPTNDPAVLREMLSQL